MMTITPSPAKPCANTPCLVSHLSRLSITRDHNVGDSPPPDWVTEAKEIKPGLLAAQALLPDSDRYAAICLINVSGEEQYIDRGHFIGSATPGYETGPDRSADGETEVGMGCAGQSDAVSLSVKPPHVSPQLQAVRPTVKPISDAASSLADSQLGSRRRAKFDCTGVVCSVDTRDCESDFGSNSLSKDNLPTIFNSECAHIKPIIDNLPNELVNSERQRVIDLLVNNADLFSRHEFDLGRTTLLECGIDTGQHRPIAQPLRCHARVHLDVIDETVDKMVTTGIVEPACSAWTSNVVVVARPGNPIPRITLDYRQLNEITYKDKFPLPRVNDCLEALHGNVFFSSLDLSSSFNQISLRPCDRDKTAFITRAGQFRWTTMPQGACNSPCLLYTSPSPRD